MRAQFAGSVRRRDAEPDAALFPACPSKPANELEGLIRDKLPDPVRRHLIDVIIDPIDADGCELDCSTSVEPRRQ